MAKQKTRKRVIRRIVIAVIIIILLAAIIAGGILLYKRFNNIRVKVYDINELNVGAWNDSSSVSGTISNNTSQSIVLEPDKEVAKVYVKNGDRVKKGDKLFKYDVTLSELELSSSKLNKKSLEIKIKTLEDQIKNPRKYLMEEYKSEYPEANSNSSEEVEEVVDEKGKVVSEDPSAQNIEKEEVIVITQDEVTEYVSGKETEIREVQLELSKAELEVAKLQKALKNKVVKSRLDGIVQMGSENSDVYMTVQSADGMYIQGRLNEYLLGTVNVGDIFQGEDYYTGEIFEAEIKSISEYPSESGQDTYFDGSAGANVSYYEFSALILDDVQVDVGDDVNLKIQETSNEEAIYLEKAFVINDNGKNYVYIKDENEKLKKQRVELGKTIEGSVVEIKKGLSMEDRLAFPYGKEVKEGVRTRDAEINELYE